MRRWIISAALALALLATPLSAQRRGGMAFGSAGRVGVGVRAPAMNGRGSITFGARRGGMRFGSTFRRPFFFFPNRFVQRRFFRGYSWGYPYVSAYYVYPEYDTSYTYPAAQSTFQGYNLAASYFDNSTQIQQDQIERLQDEVDRLREEREEQLQPPPRPEVQPATTLVFQDKHTEEVQNYAIVGQTLWIFTETNAGKVPLDTLNVPATVKANEDHGVDFHLPE